MGFPVSTQSIHFAVLHICKKNTYRVNWLRLRELDPSCILTNLFAQKCLGHFSSCSFFHNAQVLRNQSNETIANLKYQKFYCSTKVLLCHKIVIKYFKFHHHFWPCNSAQVIQGTGLLSVGIKCLEFVEIIKYIWSHHGG